MNGVGERAMDADVAEPGEGEGLRNVAAGLRLVLMGIAATAVVQVGFAVASAPLIPTEPGKDPAEAIQSLRRSNLLRALAAERPTAATVLNGLVVLASVLGVAGKVFCVRGPESSRASGFFVASIACDAMGLALYAAGQAGPVGEASAELGDVAPLLWMLGYFLFLRGLARLAEHLKSPDLMRRTKRQQVGSLALFLGSFLAAALAGSGGAVGMILPGAIIMVGILVLFALYARLVLDLRRASEARADASSEPA
jgi:hypothetical protein